MHVSLFRAPSFRGLLLRKGCEWGPAGWGGVSMLTRLSVRPRIAGHIAASMARSLLSGYLRVRRHLLGLMLSNSTPTPLPISMQSRRLSESSGASTRINTSHTLQTRLDYCGISKHGLLPSLRKSVRNTSSRYTPFGHARRIRWNNSSPCMASCSTPRRSSLRAVHTSPLWRLPWLTRQIVLSSHVPRMCLLAY